MIGHDAVKSYSRCAVFLNMNLSLPTHESKTPVFQEAGYIAQVIDLSNEKQVTAFQALRYRYFVLKRGWVKPTPRDSGRESDGYDENAWHLGVFKEYQGTQHLCCYLRLVPSWAPQGFMLDHEFSTLAPWCNGDSLALRESKSAEISRLVVCDSVASDAIAQGLSPILPVELLFKLFYHVALWWELQRFFIVVEENWLPLFRRRFGFPFQPIGLPHTFPDGTRTVAATSTLPELEKSLEHKNLSKLTWYRNTFG